MLYQGIKLEEESGSLDFYLGHGCKSSDNKGDLLMEAVDIEVGFLNYFPSKYTTIVCNW